MHFSGALLYLTIWEVESPRDESRDDDDDDVDGNFHRHRRPKMLLYRGTDDRLEEEEEEDGANADDRAGPCDGRYVEDQICV